MTSFIVLRARHEGALGGAGHGLRITARFRPVRPHLALVVASPTAVECPLVHGHSVYETTHPLPPHPTVP